DGAVDGERADGRPGGPGDGDGVESQVTLTRGARDRASEDALPAVGTVPGLARHAGSRRPRQCPRPSFGSDAGLGSISPSFQPNSTLPRILEPAATVRLPAFRSPASVPDSLNSTRDAATRRPRTSPPTYPASALTSPSMAAPGSMVSSPFTFTVPSNRPDPR